MARGAGVCCQPNEKGIDLIIPVLLQEEKTDAMDVDGPEPLLVQIRSLRRNYIDLASDTAGQDQGAIMRRVLPPSLLLTHV
jgi:hypothetical protein